MQGTFAPGGARNAPVEPNHGQQQDRADDVERPGGVDGRGGVGGPKERNGHLGSKGCQQQFDVLDAKPTQPTDVTANQDRGRERGGDYRKEQKHRYPEAVA